MKKTFVTLAIVAALSACSDSDDSPIVFPPDDATDSDSSSLISRLTTEIDDEGYSASHWACYDQNDEFVAKFVFATDGEGQLAQEGDAEEVVNFTWLETTGNTILMSIETQGDSQLQTIAFSEDGNFSTTDSSIAGTAPGPLMCEFVDLPENSGF